MNTPNIVYLLGAGASAGSNDEASGANWKGEGGNWVREFGVPVVKQLPKEFERFVTVASDILRRQQAQHITSNNTKQLEKIDTIITNLNNISSLLKIHSSFDVLAKKFFISNNIFELKQLKFFIALFLLWNECGASIDKRYDDLLVTYLDKTSRSLIPSVNILTWNYDLQIERSYSSIFRTTYNERLRFLGCSALSMSTDGNKDYNINSGSLIKINGDYSKLTSELDANGITSTNVPLDSILAGNYKLIENYETFLKTFNKYVEAYTNDKMIPDIQFAWEVKPKIHPSVTEILQKTNIIIVIGYSFPFINREIDRLIFSNLSNGAEVYIQDKHNAPGLVSKLKDSIDWKGRVVPISYADQFFIPPNL